tara:strand:- start:234 stop:632 length:399 start_codon:yes stop_codon:yes gene_type:complete
MISIIITPCLYFCAANPSAVSSQGLRYNRGNRRRRSEKNVVSVKEIRNTNATLTKCSQNDELMTNKFAITIEQRVDKNAGGSPHSRRIYRYTTSINTSIIPTAIPITAQFPSMYLKRDDFVRSNVFPTFFEL